MGFKSLKIYTNIDNLENDILASLRLKKVIPVEVEVLLNDGKRLNYYIPLQMMRGEKPGL